MRGVASIAGLLFVAAPIAGCGGGHVIEVERGSAPQVADSVFVRVTNDHFNDVRIHAHYEGGSRYALGMVVGKSQGPLTGFLWQPRALVFEVDLIGPDEAYFSDEVVASRGDVIQLTIPPNIASSLFFHRR